MGTPIDACPLRLGKLTSAIKVRQRFRVRGVTAGGTCLWAREGDVSTQLIGPSSYKDSASILLADV